jgi:hypothetical protein
MKTFLSNVDSVMNMAILKKHVQNHQSGRKRKNLRLDKGMDWLPKIPAHGTPLCRISPSLKQGEGLSKVTVGRLSPSSHHLVDWVGLCPTYNLFDNCLIYGCLCRGCVASSFAMQQFSKPFICH